MAVEKEEAEKLMMEYEYYKGQIESIQEGINLIDGSIIQIDTSIQSLKGVSEMGEDNEILLPVGADSFLKARITDRENAIVGVGADVAVKKSLNDAVLELKERRAELEKIRKERISTLEQVASAAQKVAPRLQEILQKSQKPVQ